MRNQHIPTTAAPLPFTPPSIIDEALRHASFDLADTTTPEATIQGLKAGGVDLPVFLVKPMTEAEFDRLGYELFRHNLVPPSDDSFRALVITEVYEIFGDEKGEDLANLLDQYWQSEDVHRQQMAEWHEQDRQRMLDEHAGTPPRKPMPLPQRLMGLRDRNRALQLFEETRTKSQKLRDMTVLMQTYEPIQRAGLARLVVLGWTGVDTPYERVDGIIPEATYAALRAEIGKQAIAELEMFVSSLGTVSETERGNSVSPPPTEPAPNSSQEPSEAGSDGASTSAAESTHSNSSSEATLASGSDETTDESSISTSDSDGDTSSTSDTLAEA